MKAAGAITPSSARLIVTALTTVFAIPFGLFTAIYLVEYADGSRFSKAVTALVDVMTGIPSIVAGLFAYALFVLIDGPRSPLRARRRRRAHRC